MAGGQDKAVTVLQRWERMLNAQRVWHPLWQDVADLIHPRQSNITQSQTPAMSQTERLYDSTAVHSNTLLAASMQGSLTSSSVSWFSIRIRGLELDKEHAITQYLEQCASIMHDEIRQSNFSAQAHELYADLGAFGVGALFLGEKEKGGGRIYNGLRFEALAPGQYAVDEDAEGQVNCLYYCKRMTAQAAVGKFGSTVAPKTMQMAERGEQELLEYVHGVYPRGQYDREAYGASRANKLMPYTSCWVEVHSKNLVAESGFHEFPFMVPRWAKSTGEVYGRGPGFVALPDVKTLNKAVELKLKALSKAIDPPIKARNDGVIGAVRLTPGSITYVRDMDAVQALDLGGRFDVADMEEEKLRANIRRIFFTDQLQLQEGPQMTAYEVQVRYELMQRILGPTLGRLEVEFLDPLLNRVFWILQRGKKLPEMPPELEAWLAAGNALDVVYEGPLARAARLSDTVATQRFLQTVLPLAEVKPDIVDIIDLDELVRDTAINTGVKAKLLRAPQDVESLREAKAQLDAQQQQMEQVGMAAQAAGSAAPALKAMIEAQQAGILPRTGEERGIA
jgi:hypothetical protein